MEKWTHVKVRSLPLQHMPRIISLSDFAEDVSANSGATCVSKVTVNSLTNKQATMERANDDAKSASPHFKLCLR